MLINNIINHDVLDFVAAADCQDAADEIANKVISFSNSKPTEEEVLSRCRHVFEYVLHRSLQRAELNLKLSDFEVEIQTEQEK